MNILYKVFFFFRNRYLVFFYKIFSTFLLYSINRFLSLDNFEKEEAFCVALKIE
jgi:hypothetical protein